MTRDIFDYVHEKDVNPATMAIIQTIIQTGNGLPIRFLQDQMSDLEDAQELGYISLSDGKIFLTQKSNLFIKTLLQLAHEAGEV